jgi:uncharacterized BrkB/YihY/UPF0761 family membrane protein
MNNPPRSPWRINVLDVLLVVLMIVVLIFGADIVAWVSARVGF